jgi:hypothetical protein
VPKEGEAVIPVEGEMVTPLAGEMLALELVMMKNSMPPTWQDLYIIGARALFQRGQQMSML